MDILTWESVGMEPPVVKNDPIRKRLCSVSAQLLPVRQCLCSLCSNLSIISIMHIWEHRDTEGSQTESWKDSFRNQITVGSDRVSCQCRFAFIPQVCWPNDGIKWTITGRRPSRHELLLVIQSVSLCDGYAQSWAASMASSLRINNLWDCLYLLILYNHTVNPLFLPLMR